MSARHPLRALFFDIDDTLYSTSDFVATARGEAVRAMVRAGIDLDEETVLHELAEVTQEFGANHAGHYDKLIQRLPPGAVRPGAAPLIVAAGVIAYHQTKNRAFSPYEDALEVLRTLKDRGLALGVISAGVGIKQAEKIVRLGVDKIVDPRYVFITDPMGIAKSNPKLYARACEIVGVDPREAAYVGDHPAHDVDVPRRLGMRTFLSRRGGKYSAQEPSEPADHTVHNFWDLLDILEQRYAILPLRG